MKRLLYGGRLSRCELRIEKIVSGGQTGVDRAALDVAIFLEIPHGGWCPKNRRAEDGAIPKIYLLKETRELNYAIRTEKNVIESDGTLILYNARMSGGTELTRKLALKHRRPLECIDLKEDSENSIEQVQTWLAKNEIKVLNVAGPRESTCNGIAKQVERFLVNALRDSLNKA